MDQINRELLNQLEKDLVPQINNVLKLELPNYVSDDRLSNSMSYSVNAGGKRLRPLLTLAILKTYNVNLTNEMIKLASAIELIHTYSLIHDDLPAMDNDDLRRGKPTNHKEFDEATAILAGDGLLTLAFEWVSESNIGNEKIVKLIKQLSKSSGSNGMVAGQSIDVNNSGKKLTKQELIKLHSLKTGELIRYSVMAGLIISEASDNEIKFMMKFADSFGLAFQIYDDILDVVSNEKDLGKPVNDDADKNTYVNLYGIKKSYELLDNTIKDGLDSLNELDIDTDLLKSFYSYFDLNGR
ncbi:polyprenyl synthetase family protein [Lactobacillus sp. S2-2]|uniref:polyprenyl synthetase family protein n=1 Tax=Lactobacillus sp. S2-2 TaxID=2692917 RepID=UPI001F392CCA|nr:farnesyl diphosphate synthase [Lactobacillus sp. S2-2]MCF6515107.1 polyprenyl synthetase family protein [Lactobacillus sp. S2-2]